jgi:hypothetical protein
MEAEELVFTTRKKNCLHYAISSGMEIRWLVASSVLEVDTLLSAVLSHRIGRCWTCNRGCTRHPACRVAAPASGDWTVAQPDTLAAGQSSSSAAACSRGTPAEGQQGSRP